MKRKFGVAGGQEEVGEEVTADEDQNRKEARVSEDESTEAVKGDDSVDQEDVEDADEDEEEGEGRDGGDNSHGEDGGGSEDEDEDEDGAGINQTASVPLSEPVGFECQDCSSCLHLHLQPFSHLFFVLCCAERS